MDVDLRPDAELWQVDTGFDGDAYTFDYRAGVFRFPSVQVDAVGVDLPAEAVAESVDEVVCVSGFRDDLSGCGVYLPSLRVASVEDGIFEKAETCVTGRGDDVEDLLLFGGSGGRRRARSR